MNLISVMLLVLFVIAILIVGPWLSILAVNQLFGTAIQLTFWNWLATFWIHLIVTGAASRS